MKSASVAEIVERVQYWSRRGALEDIDDRRSRAVTQLEAMVAQMTGSEAERVSLEVSSEQANLDLLADFLAAKAGEFQRQDELLLSFGYLVGLVERSEEHTSELQSLMRISYAVFGLKKNKTNMI